MPLGLASQRLGDDVAPHWPACQRQGRFVVSWSQGRRGDGSRRGLNAAWEPELLSSKEGGGGGAGRRWCSRRM